MLSGILSKILDESELIRFNLYNEKESKIYLKALEKKFNVSITTSAGRILDATSALLELCYKRTYDGRPAMILESVATNPYDINPVFNIKNGLKILMTTPLFEFLLENIDKDKGRLAATAQIYLAKGLFDIAKQNTKGKLPIVLSGGVAYNNMISNFLIKNGVFVHKNIPSGDGCICVGQSVLSNLE